MYKLNIGCGVIRISDGIVFPDNPGSRHHAAYQAWLSEGNTPEPAETPGEIATRLRQETNTAAEQYLDKTDKWVIRFLETGEAVPSGITALRAAKRLEVE